ncbi:MULTISPECIES: hypothetical protein [unclassified Frankia]
MQSPGPGPQDPDAQTQRVDGNAGGSYSASSYSAGSAPFGDEDETRLLGNSAPGGYPPTEQYSQNPPNQYPQNQYAQNPYRGTDQYPPTGVYPPGEGYGQGYQQQDYPANSYPTESYPQQAYQQNYQPGYHQDPGYHQGYQQQGYPAAGGYGGYPPPGAPPGPAALNVGVTPSSLRRWRRHSS